MRIGLRLHDAKGDTLEEKLQSASAQGFICAHIALSKIVSGFTMNSAQDALTKEFAQECRAACERAEIEPVLLGCYLNLATPDRDELDWVMDCYKAHLRFASFMGRGVMVGTETGAPNREYRTEAACFTDEALELFVQRVAPLARYAKELGVTLLIEPVVRHIVSTPARARAVLDAVGLDSLRVIFDPVNLLDLSNEQGRDAIFKEYIRLLGGDVRLIHIKDYLPQDMRSVAAGLGAMDYRAILRFANEHGLPMTLEDTTPNNAVAAKRYLEEMTM